MKIFKTIIVALGVASIGIAAAPAVAQDMHHDRDAYHRDDRGMNDHRGMHDGRDRNWRNHHRHCRTEWRHHHRVQHCW
jgi:Ni/Co efflux regulator RcnB